MKKLTKRKLKKLHTKLPKTPKKLKQIFGKRYKH